MGILTGKKPKALFRGMALAILLAPAGVFGQETVTSAAGRRDPLSDIGGAARATAMGGAFAGGNVMPGAEFNIFVDPEAAAVVLGCGRPITLIPLDCTWQVRAMPERLAAIAGIGTRSAEVVSQIMAWRADSEGGPGRPLHDACVIARLLQPGLFSGPLVAVQVETASELTRGMTLMDRRGRSGLPANCRVLLEVDAKGFFDLLGRLLAKLP